MGSLVGAVIGGIVIGIIEAQTQWYLGNAYRDLSVYIALFLMLIFHPGGLRGNQFSHKADMKFKRV